MHDFTLEIVTHSKYRHHVASLLFTVVDCGILINPTNGQVSHTAGTTYRQKATYSCDAGFNLVGDNIRMCQVAGVWSGNAPTCQGELLISHNTRCVCVYKYYLAQEGSGVYYANTMLVVFSLLFDCVSQPDFALHSSVSLILTVVNCGTLTDPANGQVSHTAETTLGQTATYSCDTGYNLVGNTNRICQATGVWSGREPICQGMLLLEYYVLEYVYTYTDKLQYNYTTYYL